MPKNKQDLIKLEGDRLENELREAVRKCLEHDCTHAFKIPMVEGSYEGFIVVGYPDFIKRIAGEM